MKGYRDLGLIEYIIIMILFVPIFIATMLLIYAEMIVCELDKWIRG